MYNTVTIASILLLALLAALLLIIIWGATNPRVSPVALAASTNLTGSNNASVISSF
jgi:hypothetical protein